MKRFAALLDGLVFTSSREAKLRRLVGFFREVPDPERGWALAALAGALPVRTVTPRVVRRLIEERVDAHLFRLSHDYVGDLAETVSLMWPDAAVAERPPPTLDEVVSGLREAPAAQVAGRLAGWLDELDPPGRFALLKLLLGNLRVGVSGGLAKAALARFGGVDVAAIEERWHGLRPPYRSLFAWLEGRAAAPVVDMTLAFRPMMLAQPLDEARLDALPAADFAAEWKWDGIRVQLVGAGGHGRLYARSGEDIGEAFPDVLAGMAFDAVLDGELLAIEGGEVAPFAALQKRLGRRRVTAALLERHPVRVRLYDILALGGEDLRNATFAARRTALEQWFAAAPRPGLDLSPLVPFGDWDALRGLRGGAGPAGSEGLVLKRLAGPYLAGRPAGQWLKWKRPPFVADCVLMYAQRGHGRRSSYYADYTFGCWRAAPDGARELVPVGKAYSGYTDEELHRIDGWVRRHSSERYGPVRAVTPGLVFEVAFEGVQRSTRHRAGLALRFPRISRVRWDKPAAEADEVAALERLLASERPSLQPPGALPL